MANYSLEKLIKYFNAKVQSKEAHAIFSSKNYAINQLKLDSRLVSTNDIFVALKGQCRDGKDFIAQAIDAGAIAILVETNQHSDDGIVTYYQPNNRPCIRIDVYQLSQRISAFAAEFYGYPSDKMRVVGVTGTNGKTTVTQLIAQWAVLLGKKSAVLGTIGNGVLGQLTPSANTTPSNVDIQHYLADFLANKVDVVAMEVSSHGLALGRVEDVSFSASVFTNLSRDHLDFHHTMAKYETAKWSLFSPAKTELAVISSGKRIINYDDTVGNAWINRLDDVMVVSANPDYLMRIRQLDKPYIAVSSLEYHNKGVSIHFDSSFGHGTLESRLFGAFNVSNLLVSFATLLALDFPFSRLVNTASYLLPVTGRMEIFTGAGKPTAIVDYAHTPDALDKALSAAKEHCHGRLWVIFGCGGDRDNGKRSLMAKVAQSYTDNIIVTNDNPRTEDQDQIIEDILKGFSQGLRVEVIKERYQAIKWAMKQANEDDVILIAGKGHEDYQIIGEIKHHYSDREAVQQLLGIAE
ncbi:UDP-N-acetylmuramoylalanyl-D-glutamate--2,6-diaminopimelate ligase [Orbus hercynius]|uniref:UDP-N-acetylmuramoyl-L-alanyl-D-glutamate--2,6-diaminopimelate ligase n=1 Tax=Orbus hercynius TaxID=593135 RepID=A0A495RHN5_9GAMM|nr:UDP-N-acetylmuramoyl-L-alanyl-D-glutamate--2,6-diaminopimelate ligase [Orbus hercynius]RKS86939.1 UDP-N-acetylmuramoylalanyl-D-glutamate--2,6-diaminopimelate ligase [Orbus hercynius]